ncbi:MAG: heme-copper oxidase subunit III [bacterium]
MKTEATAPQVQNSSKEDGKGLADLTAKPTRRSQASTGSSVNKALLGLLLFLGTEVMFFGGLISTFLILRAGSSIWPPPDQPRLPIEVTGINTVILLISGFAMFRAVRAIQKGDSQRLARWMAATAALGAVFLGVQGSEWIRLVKYGLTFTSSVFGATFYTLIGCHALHVTGGMLFLLFVLKRAFAGVYSREKHSGVLLCSLYWYFVVGIWPFLYILVYLN